MHLFSKINQYLSGIIIYPIFKILFKININGKENLKGLSGPLIFASNHIRFYDSFLFRFVIGNRFDLLPLRFMATRKFIKGSLNFFYWIGIIPLVYALFGVFIVTQGEGVDKGLIEPKKIISRKGHIVMYPEGRMYQHGIIGPFKWGVAILAADTDCPIVPVSIRKVDNHFVINIGKVFSIDPAKSPTENTEIIRDRVVELYEVV